MLHVRNTPSRRRAVGCAVMLSVAVLWPAGTAVGAAGPPVFKATTKLMNAREVQFGTFPCTDLNAKLKLVESGTIHVVALQNGTVHFAGTLHGRVSGDALPADGTPDFTGSFVEAFGGNGHLTEDGGAAGKAVTSFVLNGAVHLADGSTVRLHQNQHTVFDRAGLPKLDADKVKCHQRST